MKITLSNNMIKTCKLPNNVDDITIDMKNIDMPSSMILDYIVVGIRKIGGESVTIINVNNDSMAMLELSGITGVCKCLSM